MKLKTVWGVYFSATGTTEEVVICIAKKAAELLEAEYKAFSFSLPDARRESLSFTGDDLVIFGIPVYAGRIPNLLLPYARGTHNLEQKHCISLRGESQITLVS